MEQRRLQPAGSTRTRAQARALALALVLSIGAGAALPGCVALPPLDGRSVSSALAGTGATRLGSAVAPLAAAHPGASGVLALADGRDAFAARVMLARAAERSLDIQYYIWRKDITGVLLFDALREAAGRGVRVRLLLDDNNTAGLDATLALLDAHPNVEVRLFNPFALRSPRVLGYLTDFFRLNRRMHNKSFTADSQATIVGGRNIGDEYFAAAGEVLFADLDVMAVGPVVDAVSRDFDRYWNSRSAYPLQLLVPAPALEQGRGGPELLAAEAERVRRSPAARDYTRAVRASTFAAQLEQRRLPFEWAATRLLSDDPARALGLAEPDDGVARQLSRLFGEPVAELDLVSPYFVPGAAGTEAFAALARRGVKVQVLTNSLEATDVAAVHSGYAKWRKPLLQAGVALFELRRSWAPDERAPAGSGPAPRSGSLGSSASSLHTKTVSIDRGRVFIGSFNFDPRSARLNTEMGFVIESPAMAQQMAAALRRSVPSRAYEVRLADDGSLYWLERAGGAGAAAGQAIRHDTEPGTGFWQRLGVRVLSWLPIDWLL